MAAPIVAVWFASVCPALADSEPLPLLRLLGATERHASDHRSGFGLSGYDPVSYFVQQAPAPGLARYEAVWAGLAWRFGSRANREAFLRDPHAFLPRIGGYDAFAAMAGRVAAADPLIFAVLGGRLYLFRTAEGRRRFLSEGQAAAKAEAGWLRVRPELAGG